jgi:hypothetical protein
LHWLVWQTDFSATYACVGTDAPTCSQANTCIQAVFIVSYLEIYIKPDDTEGQRQVNDSWHFWGEVNKQSCPSNYVFHNTCLRTLYKYYSMMYPGRFKDIIDYSDGCPEQYKSKYASYEMTYICRDLGIDSYFKCYPPTAQFKGPSDSSGNDTKIKLSRMENAGTVRCTNAWDCFLALEKFMPPPINHDNDYKMLFHIRARHHRYVVKEDHMTPEMVANQHVVKLLGPNNPEKDGREIIGMRQVTNSGSQRNHKTPE